MKGSEGNSESMLLFLVHGTEFRVVFSSAEGFGTDFRDFLFRGIAGIPSDITLCSVYSVFRGIIFLSEIPNPSASWPFMAAFWKSVCFRFKTADFGSLKRFSECTISNFVKMIYHAYVLKPSSHNPWKFSLLSLVDCLFWPTLHFFWVNAEWCSTSI